MSSATTLTLACGLQAACAPKANLPPVQGGTVFAVSAGLSYVFQVAIGLQAALFALAVRNRYRR